jgi:hypothetical protein
MTEYTTGAGVRLEVGKLPRQTIDRFVVARLPPEPPTREAEAFGGIVEEIPVLDDPAYLAQLQTYYTRLGDEQIDLVAGAVEVMEIPEREAVLIEMEDLCSIGLAEGDDHASWLRHIVLASDKDLASVVELVFYHSIVTVRGIEEATRAFNVTWMGQPVTAWHVPRVPGRYSQQFEDRKVAQYCHYTWREFSALPGPEQSAEVAFYRLRLRLDWLMSQK